MNFYRSIVLAALLFGISVNGFGAAIDQTRNRPKISHILKKIVIAAAGVRLGLTAYIASELPVVLAHEYGHLIGNSLTGGAGGQVHIECNLFKHPLAVFMPFFGCFESSEKDGNSLVTLAAGPLAGIASSYAIMVAANAFYASKKGATKQESIQAGIMSPISAYTKISDEIAQMIVQRENYKMLSFSEICMMIFNILRATKMFGECIYGLTPISVEHGDGQKIWQELGLKKDMTVGPMTGLSLALLPAIGSIAFGIAKGVYARLKVKDYKAEAAQKWKSISSSKNRLMT